MFGRGPTKFVSAAVDRSRRGSQFSGSPESTQQSAQVVAQIGNPCPNCQHPLRGKGVHEVCDNCGYQTAVSCSA